MVDMNTKQLNKFEKMNVINYLNTLNEQREEAAREWNQALEVDTTNMLIGAKNILRLLGLEDLIKQ